MIILQFGHCRFTTMTGRPQVAPTVLYDKQLDKSEFCDECIEVLSHKQGEAAPFIHGIMEIVSGITQTKGTSTVGQDDLTGCVRDRQDIFSKRKGYVVDSLFQITKMIERECKMAKHRQHF